MEEAKRKCNKCFLEKPTSDFSPIRDKRDGRAYLQTYCKPCMQVVVSVHHKRYADTVRRYLWDYLLKNPCVSCGESNPLVLDMAHRERPGKVANISTLMCRANQGPKQIEILKKEMEKCFSLCRNCHQLETHKENNSWKWRFSKGDF